ncbi:MAG TPA: serine hydrolase domain-containing protein [Cyclobacteriaceae bacterium]|nr:serine hydrolase domain-containing protein [Cyclobacteriaceae bacterium]
MARILTLLILVGIVVSACQAPKNEETTNTGVINDAAKTRIDSTLKAMVDAGKIAGASALIVEKDKEVYFNSFGNADTGKPFDRNTIVRIFSMTKPVTGVALMQLYEKGMFQLDDPLEKYAPEFANMKVSEGADAKGKPKLVDPKRPITIRDITRHTAGFPNPQANPELADMIKAADVMNKENTLTQMAQKLGKLPLGFHPGEKWSYGVSVDVQAFLVERLSGKPFDQYVRENILDPLGMKDTRYVPQDMSRLAAMYMKSDTALSRIPDEQANAFNSQEWPLKPGGFGLTSTVDDYQRFARMLVNEGTFEGVTILKPETVKLMATNHLDESVTERMWLPSKGQVGFGIDFAVRLRAPQGVDEKNGVVGEFFWDGAASTLFWVDPANELTAVMFVQIFPFSNELHKVFRDAVYGPIKLDKPVASAGQ